MFEGEEGNSERENGGAEGYHEGHLSEEGHQLGLRRAESLFL